MKTALIIIAVIAALFLIVFFGGGYVMFVKAMKRDRSGKRQINYWEDGGETKGFFLDLSEETKALMTEGARKIKKAVTDVAYITSHDGLRLCAHIVENPAGRGVAILFHGYRSCGLVDYSCLSDYFYKAGFTLVFPDHRAHGESEGEYITFGAHERYDAVDWAKYAEKRFPEKPILLCGVSMGAATVMMGAGVGYPSSVKAILADCGYTTPGAICRKCMKQWYHLPSFPIYNGAKLWVKWLAKFDTDGVSARKSLEKLRGTGIKVLIIHGTGDGFVPYEMSLENIKAFDYMPESARREVMEFFSVEGADHAVSYLHDTDGYIAAAERLLKKADI